MKDYKMITIVPKLKSQLQRSGNRQSFTVIDDCDHKYTCFNYYLYDGIQEGKKIKIRIADDKRSVIVEVVGFTPNYPTHKHKRLVNVAEAELFDLMEGNGWELSNKGWPDFACFKDGKLVLIEVKPKRSHRLKSWQHKLTLELAKHGVRCYRWSPDGGFEPICGNVRFPIDLP